MSALKKYAVSFLMLMIGMNALMAQGNSKEKAAEEKYRQVVEGRADKIVKGLDIADSSTYYAVKHTIADYYVDLNRIYAERDTMVNVLKRKTNDKTVLNAEKEKIEKQTEKDVAAAHAGFVNALAKRLNEKQVAGVKDGLTYNVLNVTYIAYNDMIPTLTEPQKAQIMEWLVEAREHAMDGESSDKKHWWFGKYKGRINNYLSAQGYDLQAERAAWEKRIAENKTKGN